MATREPPARWWDGDQDEGFWLEITDRDDLRVDLNAPASPDNVSNYSS